MDHFFIETLHIPESLFSYLILPLLIFLARVCDVSINTVRIIYMLGGRRFTATILGFFEAFIWLMAIRQIFQHLDNWICYVAYPAGFATGVLVGMIIEERIAYGKVVVRIITREDTLALTQYLAAHHFRFTSLKSVGAEGEESVVFCVLNRERLDFLLANLKSNWPSAFYTVEGVKAAAESGTLPETAHRYPFITRFRSVIRS